MLYFDIIPRELLHQILYNVLERKDVLTLYNSNISIFRQVLDDPNYWNERVRYYIIPFIINSTNNKQFININYKAIPSDLLNYASEDIYSKMYKYERLVISYTNVISDIKQLIIQSPTININCCVLYALNTITNFELVCPHSVICDKFEILNMIATVHPVTYSRNTDETGIIGISFNRGSTFYFTIVIEDIEHFKYEVGVQNVFDLLLHLYCNGATLI